MSTWRWETGAALSATAWSAGGLGASAFAERSSNWRPARNVDSGERDWLGPAGGGAWKISFAEKEFEPYRTQGEAISAAVDAAHRAGAENAEGAQVE